MNKELPDKYIRQAIFSAINNIVVDSNTIPCYDYRVTGANKSPHYVLMTTQTNTVSKANKCEFQWQSTILLDIVTTYSNSSNLGSRLLADNICDRVRDLTDTGNLTLSNGFEIVWQEQSFPNDIVTITQNDSIFRKFVRIEFYIN